MKNTQYLSLLEFRKGGRIIVMRGMTHYGPQKMYQYLQDELNRYIANGFRLYHEACGIHEADYGMRPGPVLDIFRSLIHCQFEVISQRLGMTTQTRALTYPDDAVLADYSIVQQSRIFSERLSWAMVRQEKRGIKAVLSEYSMEELLQEYLELEVDEKPDPGMERRELRALGTILQSDDSRIFVHFGCSHLKGFEQMLMKEGWQLAAVSNLYVEDFLNPAQKKILERARSCAS